VAALFAAPARPAAGFYRDTHFDLTYALARASGYSAQDALWIASADWVIDRNPATSAGRSPLAPRRRAAWHAFGHSEERFNELWERVSTAEEPRARLVFLGEFLHFVQDWESHAGFSRGMGHALATLRGHDPDSLGLDLAADRRMVQATVYFLCRAAGLPGRTEEAAARTLEVLDRITRDGLTTDLYDESDPAWRARVTGRPAVLGNAILRANRSRIETFLGEPVPDVLGMVLTRTGELRALLPEDPEGARRRLSVRVARTWRTPRGLGVRLKIRNTGLEALAPGSLDVVAMDVERAAPIGRLRQELPPLAPGTRRKLVLDLPAELPLHGPVLVTAVSTAPDLALAEGSDWAVDGESREPGSNLLFVGPPRFWASEGGLGIELSAALPGLDAAPRLGEVRLWFQGSGAGESFEPVWSPASDPGAGRVSAVALFSTPLARESCRFLAAGGPIGVALFVNGRAQPRNDFPLEPDARRAILSSCAESVAAAARRPFPATASRRGLPRAP
jgi:hypothetical protein